MPDNPSNAEASQAKLSNDDKALTLRDHLAMERTSLASERTLLAYARTAILLAGSGLTLIKLQPTGSLDHLLAGGLLLAAIIVSLFGLLRFRAVRKRMLG